ncbi:MAG: hypothetical protein WC501_03670 [Candidatus Micrarchaeia archaeon]
MSGMFQRTQEGKNKRVFIKEVKKLGGFNTFKLLPEPDQLSVFRDVVGRAGDRELANNKVGHKIMSARLKHMERLKEKGGMKAEQIAISNQIEGFKCNVYGELPNIEEYKRVLTEKEVREGKIGGIKDLLFQLSYGKVSYLEEQNFVDQEMVTEAAYRAALEWANSSYAFSPMEFRGNKTGINIANEIIELYKLNSKEVARRALVDRTIISGARKIQEFAEGYEKEYNISEIEVKAIARKAWEHYLKEGVYDMALEYAQLFLTRREVKGTARLIEVLYREKNTFRY